MLAKNGKPTLGSPKSTYVRKPPPLRESGWAHLAHTMSRKAARRSGKILRSKAGGPRRKKEIRFKRKTRAPRRRKTPFMDHHARRENVEDRGRLGVGVTLRSKIVKRDVSAATLEMDQEATPKCEESEEVPRRSRGGAFAYFANASPIHFARYLSSVR